MADLIPSSSSSRSPKEDDTYKGGRYQDLVLDFEPYPSGDSSMTSSETKISDAIQKEVSEWLELNERDGCWPSHQPRLWDMEQPHRDLEIANVHDIAIQLLASCFTDFRYHISSTTLPAALYVSRTRPTTISVLKMHAQYRFSPCHGYHPRETSPAPAWLGLCTGLSPEERLAKRLSKRRQLQRSSSGSACLGDGMHWNEEHIGGDIEHVYQPRRLSQEVDVLPPTRSATPELNGSGYVDEGDDLLVKHLGARIKRSRSFWFGHITAKSLQ